MIEIDLSTSEAVDEEKDLSPSKKPKSPRKQQKGEESPSKRQTQILDAYMPKDASSTLEKKGKSIKDMSPAEYFWYQK